MKYHRCWWLFVLVLSSVFASAAEVGPVYVVPLKSEVSEAQFYFLRRALKTAERDHASAFVIDMATNGGEVMAAIDNMNALLKTTVPTYTFVDGRALSAGALIALATQKIYMSPTAAIGAAAPVDSSGADLAKTMADKTSSAMSAIARAAAQKNGHRPEVADAFIKKEKELKIGDVVIDGSDSLLTLSAEEAARVYDGKPLLATGIATSVEDMLKKEGLTGIVRTVSPTGFERLAFWITTLAPLLLLGGIICGYIEFKIPGFGIFGVSSIICFFLFFAGHYIAGLAGWEASVCFALGLALVLGELIIHPGTVAPGIVGVMLMISSLIYAMIDRWPSQPIWPTQDMLLRPVLNLGVALGAAILLAYFLAKYLPNTPFYHRIVLGATVPSSIPLPVSSAVLAIAAGMTGIARTTLRPSGKAIFGEQLVDVVSRGEYIPAEAPVQIVQIEGSRVVVEPA